MILLRIRFSDDLIQSFGGARVQPQKRPYVDVVKCPERRVVPKPGMDVSRVEQACTCIVQGDSQLTTGFTAQNGEQDRTEVSLFFCQLIQTS